ncbi:MAG: right-handed parallel beta-helix repeat-containing protein [Crocinitomicaceae bacterium]|nr:right-handed parallel beta-helix repeat-containing protein [Flavobacteriales bacterium]NQZ35933.1 right-handed parallel beta-helix repeat-containing protein [Crocinitomicaceae bacterium]
MNTHKMNVPKHAILLLLTVLSSFCIKANTYYVSNSGNDANTGGTSADAFLTIQYATDLVIAGDTVLVQDGTYAGFDLRNVNGTAANPIVFIGNGTNVLINQNGPLRDDGINIENADYVIIDGFIVNNMPGNGNGIRLVLSNNCIVRNCFCDSNAERGIFTGFTDDILIEHNVCTNSIDEHGIYVSNSSDRPIIRFNECYGNNSTGIHMNGDLSLGGDGIISDALIYGNIIHDNNGAAGINMDGLQDPTIYNNLIYNNHSAQGIAIFQGDGAIVTNGAKIYNNTIIVPSDGRWGILVANGGNINTEIYNNIIINQHAWRGCIAVESTNQFTCDYNILNDKMSNVGDGSAISLVDWQALGFDNNSLLADASNLIWINPTANDYQLAVGSQAINTGTDLVSAIVMVDLNGYPRPSGLSYDIGAYEDSPDLSITENSAIQVRVFPNPASNYLNLEYDDIDIKEITLVDLNGRLIKSFSPNHVLQLTNIPRGLYVIHIHSKNGNISSSKLMIH